MYVKFPHSANPGTHFKENDKKLDHQIRGNMKKVGYNTDIFLLNHTCLNCRNTFVLYFTLEGEKIADELSIDKDTNISMTRQVCMPCILPYSPTA